MRLDTISDYNNKKWRKKYLTMANRTEMEMDIDPWDQMNCIQMRLDTISDYNDKRGEANI